MSWDDKILKLIDIDVWELYTSTFGRHFSTEQLYTPEGRWQYWKDGTLLISTFLFIGLSIAFVYEDLTNFHLGLIDSVMNYMMVPMLVLLLYGMTCIIGYVLTMVIYRIVYDKVKRIIRGAATGLAKDAERIYKK